jgi:hypothetical protein
MPVRQVATVLHRGFEMVDDAKLHQFMGQMLSDRDGVRPRSEHRADTGLRVSRGAWHRAIDGADVACQANNLAT